MHLGFCSRTESLESLVLECENIHGGLGQLEIFVVWSDNHAEEWSTHVIEVLLLLAVRLQVHVARIDSEEWMTMIPGQFHDTILVDLLLNTDLLGVTDLTVSKPLSGRGDATFSGIDLANNDDFDQLVATCIFQLCFIDLAAQDSNNLILRHISVH